MKVETSANQRYDHGYCPSDSLLLEVCIRVRDFILALFCLLLFLPLILFLALLIKWEDGGHVFYVQERIGKGGRPFYIFKLRCMHMDAEKDGPQLVMEGETDTRLTRIGVFMRVHHLDELPQLWNVLRGEMAFVGYRPERRFFVDQIMVHDKRYELLFRIRPGVTSYATLYNGYTDTMEKMLRRLELDLYYLDNRGFWSDLKILWLTFWRIVLGKVF